MYILGSLVHSNPPLALMLALSLKVILNRSSKLCAKDKVPPTPSDAGTGLAGHNLPFQNNWHFRKFSKVSLHIFLNP